MKKTRWMCEFSLISDGECNILFPRVNVIIFRHFVEEKCMFLSTVYLCEWNKKLMHLGVLFFCDTSYKSEAQFMQYMRDSFSGMLLPINAMITPFTR